MKKTIISIFILQLIIISACVSQNFYHYNLKDYSSKSEAYSAQDAFLSNIQKQIGEPLPEPLSNKKLLIGIPNFDTFEKLFFVKGHLSVQQRKDSKEYVTTTTEKDYLAMGKWVENKNIYKENEIIRTNGGHLQPSENEDVIYLYVEPPASLSWYIADQKYGKQIIPPDYGIANSVERNRSWLQSIQAFAIRE